MERPRSSPLNAILLLAVIGMGGFIVWQSTRGPIGPAPVVVPDHSVRYVGGADQSKTSPRSSQGGTRFSKLTAGCAMRWPALRVTRVTDTRVFAAVTTALLTDIDAAGGIPIGGDIDRAVATHLGISWGRDRIGRSGRLGVQKVWAG